jgi:hypothetical protein
MMICRDDVAIKTKPTIGTPKFLVTVVWGMEGFHVMDLMTSQNQFNSQYFMEYIMALLVEEIFPHGRNRRALRLHLHLDNCRVHFSKVSEKFFAANDILRIPQPPDGPDVTPTSMNQSRF